MDCNRVPGLTGHDQAVVLTLCRWYSLVQRDTCDLLSKSQGGIRNMWGSLRQSAVTEALGVGAKQPISADNTSSLSNPWQEQECDGDSDLKC